MSGFLEHAGVAVAEDDGVVTVRLDERHTNVLGGAHGGLIATMLDAAMAAAVRAMLADEETSVTVQLAVTYLNAASPGDELVAHGVVRKRGASVVVAEADVSRTSDEAAIAHGLGTFNVTTAG